MFVLMAILAEPIYIIVGLILFASIVISYIIRSLKLDERWFNARALTESCKTLTWRFMTRTNPFDIRDNHKAVTNFFVDRIKDLSDNYKGLYTCLNPDLLSLPVVSSKVQEIQMMDLQLRMDIYKKYRLIDQRNWYTKESRKCRLRNDIWFWITLIAQILAISIVFYLISGGDNSNNYV